MRDDSVGLQEVSREPLPELGSIKLLTVLLTIGVFWSAVLLFVVEPLFAKSILPVFGGSPSVWITCMVFFQAALLLGYLYSHLITARFTGTRIASHFAGLVLSCVVLPIAIRVHVDPRLASYHPGLLLLMIAAVSIGLPFFFLATTGPLLQRWLSFTKHPDAGDPYFLYAASNAGSLLGLALYPSVLEPRFSLSGQAWGWSVAYVVFVALVTVCSIFTYRFRRLNTASAANLSFRLSPTQQLLWIALAFVPASLLYGVTSQLSTDFPPFPLLWVAPLAIYLLTFIVGFSSGFKRLRRSGRLLPAAIAAAAALFAVGNTPLTWALTGLLKLCCFGIIALALHTELAHRRPASQHLTRFYVLVSFAGVLAGVLNGFVSPLVFPDFWEYPITLVLAAALLPAVPAVFRRPLKPILLLSAVILLCCAAVALRIPGLNVPTSMRLGTLLVGTFICMSVPTRWTAIVLLVLLSLMGHLGLTVPNTIYRARSFYGVYKVWSGENNLHSLVHGTTVHGAQRISNDSVNITPTYYAPVAPVIAISREKHPANIGIVGLGTGTIGCYAVPDDAITYFEIDPLVEKIATNPGYFTYLARCPGKKSVILGDARLTVANVPPRLFDVLILDAFTSDSVPMHLLTKEAFDLYRRALADDGVLLVHVTNRYIDLQPVVKGSAIYPSSLFLVLFATPSKLEYREGYAPSKWVAIAPADRARRLRELGWQPATGKSVLWTDDRSSLFPVVAWSRLLERKSLQFSRIGHEAEIARPLGSH